MGRFQLMRTGIILQARIGSSRLPGKILKPLGSKLMLEHIIYRVSFIRHSVQLVLATSILSRDDVLASFCQSHFVNCFRGNEHDVLERYYQCAQQYEFDHVIRLTSDNPFVDIEELDRLIDLHFKRDADYSHSFNVLPVGSGAEIFTFETLKRSFTDGIKPNHREHVNEYIQENPALFHIETLQAIPSKNRKDIRLTVDTEKDYQKACFIVKHSKSDYITTEEAIDLCSRFEGFKQAETVND